MNTKRNRRTGRPGKADQISRWRGLQHSLLSRSVSKRPTACPRRRTGRRAARDRQLRARLAALRYRFNWRVRPRKEANCGPSPTSARTGSISCIHHRPEVGAVCADLQDVYSVPATPARRVETFQAKFDTAAETEPVAITPKITACVMLRFAGGAKGCCQVSQVTAGRKTACGSKSPAQGRRWLWDSERPNELWIGRRDEPNESARPRSGSCSDPAVRGDRQLSRRSQRGLSRHVQATIPHFLRVHRRRRLCRTAPFPTFADGHREVALCEAILQSQRENRWVSVQ